MIANASLSQLVRPGARRILSAFALAWLSSCAAPTSPMMPLASESPELAEADGPPSTTRPAANGAGASLAPAAPMTITVGSRVSLAMGTAAILDGNETIPCRIVARAVTTQPTDRVVTAFDIVPERPGHPTARCELVQTSVDLSLAVTYPRDKGSIELELDTLSPMLPVCLTPREPDRALHAAIGPVSGNWFDGLFDPYQDLALTLSGNVYCEDLLDRVRLTVVTGRDRPLINTHVLTIGLEPDYLKTHHGLAGFAPVDRNLSEPMPAAWMPYDPGEPLTPDEIARNTIWMAVNLKPYGAASVLLPESAAGGPWTRTTTSAPAGRTRRVGGPAFGWDRVQKTATEVAGSFWGRGLIAQATSSTILVGRPLDLEQARLFASLLALAGRSPIAGEPMHQLPEERVDLLRRIIPAVPIRTIDLFAHHACPPLWNLSVATDAGQWNVVGLFNTSDESRTETVELEDLHLGDGVEKFAVYDLWQDRLLRVVTDRFQLRVPPSGCRVVLLARLRDDRPVLLGSNRHLSGGAGDLHGVTWNAASLTLSGRSDLVAYDPYVLRLYLPDNDRGLEIAQVRCGAVRSQVRAQDQLRCLTLESNSTGPVSWQISFDRVSHPPAPAPTQPRKLTTRQNTRGVLLAWNAGDERAVAYRVYRNQRLIAEAELCEYQDSTAGYNASYHYAVTAMDAWGNESVFSDTVVHQTPTPASTNLTRLIPVAASHGRLPIGQDRSASGGPLRLAGQRIYRGLGTVAPSRVVYFLGGGYDLFTGMVGIDDAADKRASAVFRIVADGQTLFTSPTMHQGQPPAAFSVRVRGKMQIELFTDVASDSGESDCGVWGNPYLRAAQPE